MKGKKYLVLQDEELKLVMKLVENTNKSGRWRRLCDFFSRGGGCSVVGRVYVSGENVYRIDSIFLWALNQLHLLPVSNPCWWCSKDFIIQRGLWPTLTFPKQLISSALSAFHWQHRVPPYMAELIGPQCNAAPSLFHFNSCHSSNCLLPTSPNLSYTLITHQITPVWSVSYTRAAIFQMTHLRTFWDFRVNLSTKNRCIAQVLSEIKVLDQLHNSLDTDCG